MKTPPYFNWSCPINVIAKSLIPRGSATQQPSTPTTHRAAQVLEARRLVESWQDLGGGTRLRHQRMWLWPSWNGDHSLYMSILWLIQSALLDKYKAYKAY